MFSSVPVDTVVDAALIHMAESAGINPGILRAVEYRNDLQKEIHEAACNLRWSQPIRPEAGPRGGLRVFGHWPMTLES